MLAQLALAILAAILILSIASEGKDPSPYLWLLAGFSITYLAVAPFLPKFLEKAGDSFYLVFLGISGIRFLFFISIISLLLLFRPEMKSEGLAMALAGWFVLALGIEMLAFMTNLRPNSKKQS